MIIVINEISLKTTFDQYILKVVRFLKYLLKLIMTIGVKEINLFVETLEFDNFCIIG